MHLARGASRVLTRARADKSGKGVSADSAEACRAGCMHDGAEDGVRALLCRKRSLGCKSAGDLLWDDFFQGCWLAGAKGGLAA
jgi:hypothetical protein